MTLPYELAKKLKEAGFPQPGTPSSAIVDGISPPYIPTLSELIEACGEEFRMLATRNDYAPSVGWCAYGARKVRKWHSFSEEGSTPEEAVANLWLKLHE